MRLGAGPITVLVNPSVSNSNYPPASPSPLRIHIVSTWIRTFQRISSKSSLKHLCSEYHQLFQGLIMAYSFMFHNRLYLYPNLYWYLRILLYSTSSTSNLPNILFSFALRQIRLINLSLFPLISRILLSFWDGQFLKITLTCFISAPCSAFQWMINLNKMFEN